MNVAQIESSGVNQRAIAFFGGDFKSPQRRFGECVPDGATLVGIIAVRAKRLVRSDQQNLRADALETHDMTLSKLAAVQTKVVRTNAGGQRLNVKKFKVPLVYL